MAQSPSSSSSYEDDDDNNNIHTNNEESDVQVEKKSTTNNSEEEQDVVVAVKAKKKTNQEEKEDDDNDDDEEEDNNSKKKNRYKVVSTNVNSSKRKLLKNVDEVNYKKQKNEDSIIVCLSADKQPKTPNSKLNPFGKKWSNDDELVLLEGMVNFKKTYDGGLIDSTPKYEILLESIKNSLSFAYTNKQLQNKVRSLKDKYETVVHKLMSGGCGENLFENKPHEEQLYNLSKTYWEDMKIIRQKSSKKTNKKSIETPELPYYYYLEQLCTINNGSLNSLPITPPLGLVAISAEKGWEESIGKANAVKFNQKAKDLMIAEAEVYLKRCQLMKDTTKLLLDGLKQ